MFAAKLLLSLFVPALILAAPHEQSNKRDIDAESIVDTFFQGAATIANSFGLCFKPDVSMPLLLISSSANDGVLQVRREWRTLSKADQAAFISAVKVGIPLPSLTPTQY